MSRGNPDSDREDRRVLSRAARGPDRTWAYGQDPQQVADVYLPAAESDRSGVLLVHGGFWRPDVDRMHSRPLAAHLADRGHLVVSLEYRRSPGDPDTTLADLRLAIEQLAREPWMDPGRIQAVGHSAGGHLVLVLAADEGTPLQSVLALAPVADLQEAEARALEVDAVPAFLGTAARRREDLDPARRAVPVIPVAIVHGSSDSIVPIAVSLRYLERLPEGRRPRLVTLAGTGHFEVIDPQSSAMTEVEAALDALAAVEPGIG